MGSVQVSASLLAADPGYLAEALELAASAGADMVHIDVLDGLFCPNMAFGPDLVGRLRHRSRLPFDVHLLLRDPASYIPQFIDAGADAITIHLESTIHPGWLIEQIHKRLPVAGIALNPATPVSLLEHLIDQVDRVLIMSVNPGWSFQPFLPLALRKVEQVRTMITATGGTVQIGVDGGVTADSTAPALVAAGADFLVVGGGFYGQADPAGAVRAMKALRIPTDAGRNPGHEEVSP